MGNAYITRRCGEAEINGVQYLQRFYYFSTTVTFNFSKTNKGLIILLTSSANPSSLRCGLFIAPSGEVTYLEEFTTDNTLIEFTVDSISSSNLTITLTKVATQTTWDAFEII